ncbi:uncharacterized protein LOC131049994 isoform X2 [Cryptomeria japonica]|uniref:uncharacterized protein LOC131049994 isoform X2 n=1 Tax=Cryptomeria japonica TaxID=3369 RepID=UPI0025ABE12C|nr:uncharacterized protein LOC131049994 isoform X2 [Cryptomeria japonica]
MRLCVGTPIHHSYTIIRHSPSRNLLCSTHSVATHIILKPFQFSTSACILIQSWDSIIQKNRRIRKRRGGLAVVPMAASESSASSKPFGTLFVCLGNICRSPTAEAVFRDAVQKRGLTSMFKIDSAGTIDYHEGNPADPRMRNAAKKRGIEITSISRPISPSDFKEFDLILAMDNQNKADILRAYEEWKVKYSLPNDAHKKVKLMCTYCKQCKETEVPDPYYGGPQGFEKIN